MCACVESKRLRLAIPQLVIAQAATEPTVAIKPERGAGECLTPQYYNVVQRDSCCMRLDKTGTLTIIMIFTIMCGI